MFALAISLIAFSPPRLWKPLSAYQCARAAPSSLCAVDKTSTAAAASPRFPTADTPPEEVVAAQLQALSDGNLTKVFSLFSRARRTVIVETGRAQGGGGQLMPPPEVVRRRVRALLDQACPGLIGHAGAEVFSGLALHDRS
jgi:hypothetical protein